jgi:hypothetical protein
LVTSAPDEEPAVDPVDPEEDAEADEPDSGGDDEGDSDEGDPPQPATPAVTSKATRTAIPGLTSGFITTPQSISDPPGPR